MNTRLKNLLLWIVSLVTVVIVFQLGYGLKVLQPTNISWLMTVKDDWGQHYLGWFFYRNEPWHFPLGHIDKFYYSLGTNVGFTDSIPLMAIFFKLFAPLLPADFQYLGLWLFLCYLLAAYYTILLCRLFKLGNFYTFLAVVFVLTNPVLAYRGMHPALCTQWLLIACIYLYFLSPSGVGVGKILRYQFILLLIAVLVNPYIGFMVFGFTVTTAVKICFFNKAISRKKFLGFLGGSVFSVLLAWWLVGLIEFGKHEDLGVSGAYGLYAFNLNSLYNPHSFSTILPEFKQVSWHQFESYMYLGFGVMSLLLFLLIYFLYRYSRGSRRAAFQLNGSSLIPLSVFVLCVALFAITNRITFNDKVLFTIPIPPFLTQLGDVFRASARFFWIPYYLLILFAVIALSRSKLKPRDKESILILAVFLQLYDIRPILTFRNLTYGGYETPLDDKAWTSLMSKFDDIVFYPPFESHQLTHMDYQYFCFLAARNKKTINIGYVARQDTRGMGIYKDSLSARLEEGELSPRALYITTAPYLGEFSTTLQSDPHKLHMLDGYYYLTGSEIKDDRLRAMLAAEDLKYKAKLDSGLAGTGRKTFFRETAKLPVTDGKPIHYFTQRQYNSKGFLAIDGWAFLDTTQNNKGDSIFITLSSDDRSYIAATAIQSRPDVSAHFSRPYLDDAGFKTIAFFDSVPKGIYHLGIAIKDHQGRFYHQLDGSFVKVGMAEYAVPEKTARLPDAGKIVYGLDYFKTDSGQISLSGWAAPEGSDAEHSRISGVLKSKENSYIFDMEPLSRPDVTTAFHNKFNMDNSGFRARVQQTALEKGVYQFGILIRDTRSNKESMIFTDKLVTIQ
jgi:hypothetical protein